jgi:hypothetical protein
MHGLTVHNFRLAQALAPIAVSMDQCWWYLGGAGMSFPSIQPPARLTTPTHIQNDRFRRGPGRYASVQAASHFDPADWQRYLAESAAAAEEYGKCVDLLGDARVGKPGFFRRYAAGMDTNWQIYFASDAPALEQVGFGDAARQFNGVWFDPPPTELPTDICLITRDIDSAYLDLFFRDEPMYHSVLNHARARGWNAMPFQNRFSEPMPETRRAEIQSLLRPEKKRRKR